MAFSRPYSAEYVEAKFSEVGLPLYGVLRSSPVCHPEEARATAPSLGPINGMGLGRWGFFEQLVTLSRRFALITYYVGEGGVPG
jgi:hypothetical protein